MGIVKNFIRDIAKERITIPDHLKEWIDIDFTNMRALVAHEIIIKGVNHIVAKQSNPSITIDSILLQDNEYYKFHLSKASDKHTISIQPMVLELNKDKVQFTALTPGGLKCDSKPVLTAFLGVMLSLFGDTDLGEAIMSRKLPAKIRWDGKIGTLHIDRKDFPDHLSKLPDFPMVTRLEMEHKGVWFSFDCKLTLVKIVTILINYVCEILGYGEKTIIQD